MTPEFSRYAGIAVLLLILSGCYQVLAPFLSALIWALILGVSLQPVLAWILARGWMQPGAAAALITLLLTLVLLLPVILLLPSLGELIAWLVNLIGDVIDRGLPSPPTWLVQIPLVGETLHEYWQGFEHNGSNVVAELKNFMGPLRDGLLAAGAGLGRGILQLALSLAILFFVLRDGPRWVEKLRAVSAHLIGSRGAELIEVARQTIRSVVNGILGTALAQAVLALLGFWIAGVDKALFLGFLTFFLSFIPLGPALLWIPAAVGLYKAGATGWAIFMVLWGAGVVGTADNVLRPLLMQRGMSLPFLFIFLGVLGGALAFGLSGLFIGPTLLAVTWALLREWTVKPPPEGLILPGMAAADGSERPARIPSEH